MSFGQVCQLDTNCRKLSLPHNGEMNPGLSLSHFGQTSQTTRLSRHLTAITFQYSILFWSEYVGTGSYLLAYVVCKFTVVILFIPYEKVLFVKSVLNMFDLETDELQNDHCLQCTFIRKWINSVTYNKRCYFIHFCTMLINQLH